MFMAADKQMQNDVRIRKFRKMGEIMTVVDKEDRVLFGVSLGGRFRVPMPVPEKPYKYETLRKRLCEGKSWWGVEKL